MKLHEEDLVDTVRLRGPGKRQLTCQRLCKDKDASTRVCIETQVPQEARIVNARIQGHSDGQRRCWGASMLFSGEATETAPRAGSVEDRSRDVTSLASVC